MSPKNGKTGSSATASRKTSKGFTAEERAAMKEHIQELKGGSTDGESAVLAKIAAMPASDQAIGKSPFANPSTLVHDPNDAAFAVDQ